jgi:hypothetical protein
MHFITKKHLSRRHFLRGAGGVAIALPLLDAMIPASTAMAQSPALAQRTRFATVYIPHGKTMAKWTPKTEGKGFEFTEILKPLEGYRDQLNVISGLRLQTGYGKDGSAAANHTRASGTFLNCVDAGDDPNKMGISVDQLAAKSIGQKTPLPSLEMTIEDGRTMSWSSATTPLPMQRNPQVVFEKLFGQGGTEAERNARRDQARSLLDSVMSDMGSLRQSLGGADAARVDQYLTDVREIERRIQLAGQMPDGVTLPGRPSGIPPTFEAHLRLMFDLQTLAWQTDLTRVTTLMLAREVSGATYPNSGVRDAFHNLSHHSNVQANKDRFAVLNAYHVSQVKYLLDKLKATPDGDGNLLDHSIILYGSGIADGNNHDHAPLPVALIGGGSGKLQGGRHIRVPDATPLANLHAAVLNKLGVETTAFGDSNGILSL